MGMCASLTRIKSIHLEHIEDLMTLPDEYEEHLDVGKGWEAIMYVFGNGFIGASITSDIFMPLTAVGDDEEIEYGGGIRYHTQEAIKTINEKIGHLTEADIRKRIVPEKMSQVYGFHTGDEDELAKICLDVITFFKRAKLNGDIITGSIE